jgi:tRNA pseudouridine55 synthase
MRGFLNINKPRGMTSRDVVNTVSKLLWTRKVGHAGTLDPLATGVLVLGVGQATRLVSCVQDLTKEYRAEFLLGRRSDSDDLEGEVVDVPGATPPRREEIELRLPQFTGRILQVPPAFSAVHVDGERAYERARRAESFDIPAREVDVHSLNILDYDYPRLTLRMECGSGTYVRSVGRDLGEALGCGAVMSGLVRTRIGEYRIEDALTLETLTPDAARAGLLPLASSIFPLLKHRCSAEDEADIRHGRSISSQPLSAEVNVALTLADGELLALARYDPGRGQLRPHLVLL